MQLETGASNWGEKVGLITGAQMGEGALERPEIKMFFLLYFFFRSN